MIHRTHPWEAVEHVVASEPPLLCPGVVICKGIGRKISDAHGNWHMIFQVLDMSWDPPTHARILVPRGDDIPGLILSYRDITYAHNAKMYPRVVDLTFDGDRYVTHDG